MPKENKQLSYKKCGQCRKDRQKCLPAGRTWPGRRCDRCLKYGYICSASRTKSQELARTSRSGSVETQDLASAPDISLGQLDRRPRSEVQCLQDLGDIRQLIVCLLDLDLETQNVPENICFETLKKALQDVVNETEAWARQYETDGRYKDAAYLYSRIHSDLKEDSRIVPTLAAVYEKMGDFPAAELAQEQVMLEIFDPWNENEEPNEEQIRWVDTTSRLFNLFHTRLQVLDSVSQPYAKTSIVYRAADLDVEQLNNALFEQGLIVPDYSDPSGYCPLHIAAKVKAPNLVRLLLQNGALLNLKDGSGVTPLHMAVTKRAREIVQLLLNNGADTEVKDSHGNTAVQMALRDEKTLSLLVEKGADIEARDRLGRTPLCNTIVFFNSPTLVRYLMKLGADANANCDLSSNSLGTLLFEAVRQKKEWAVESLLEGGADLQARDISGRRVLYYAVRGGQESMVKVLLDHGATETLTAGPVSNSGSTLLHCAMIKPNLTIVEMILKAGVDINGQDFMGDTALHGLVKNGPQPLEQTVSLLLNLGAQVNMVNNDSDTPLHLAVAYDRPTVTQMLLDAGADPRLINVYGATPLTIARNRYPESSDAYDEEDWDIIIHRMMSYGSDISLYAPDSSNKHR